MLHMVSDSITNSLGQLSDFTHTHSAQFPVLSLGFLGTDDAAVQKP